MQDLSLGLDKQTNNHYGVDTVKYEATIIGGELVYLEATTVRSALKEAGKNGPVAELKILITARSEVIWEPVYTRQFVETIAYVNAWNDGELVASVPLKVTIESYQSVKEVEPVVKEKHRLLDIWPGAVLKVQSYLAKG